MPIPVVVKVYSDRTFEFVTKSPPAAALLKKAAGIAKGSGVPNKEKVGKVTRAQVDEIVKRRRTSAATRSSPAADRRHRPQHGAGSDRLEEGIGT